MNEIFEKLRTIVNSGANKVNKDSKEFLLNLATDDGVPFKPTKCKSCWIDLAMQLAQLHKPTEGPEQGRKIWLKKGVQVYHNGQLVDCTTAMTDEDCVKMLKKGLPKRYFNFSEDFVSNDL